MIVYVVLYHDVWDLGRDPGVLNENGEPEDTTIDGIYSSLDNAKAAISTQQHIYTELVPSRQFHTIEEHELK